jgi:predicted nucleic acid-binding protein
MTLVLDAEAINALLDPKHSGRKQVMRSVSAAHRLKHDVAIATVTLAELYRGAGHSYALDALLSREGDGLLLRDTDRRLARLVGGILTGAGADSRQLADAHAVAVAVETGGGVIVTGDPKGLKRLAAPYRSIAIEPMH